MGKIAGLIRPAGDSVVPHGEPVDSVPDRLALVFQDYSRSPRDQITTRELPAFVRLRTEVSRLVRGQPGGAGRAGGAEEPGGPAAPGGAGGAEYWGRDRKRSRAARASQE
jgi:hypothetical protein